MLILIVADIHIKLGQRKVPRAWQASRIMQLAEEINKHKVDKVVIAGDLLDVAKPSVDEVGLMLDFLDAIDTETLIIPGNHEMVNKSKDCFLPLDSILSSHFETQVVREFDSTSIPNVDLIPYNIIHGDFPTVNKLAITHVRGEIPPHVLPEVDLAKFESYEKVFAGDLHSHTNSQLNILYPGSPYTTSFHRKPSNIGTTGMFIVDTNEGTHDWIQLDLPELLRYKATCEADMVADPINHVIYELEGDLKDLSQVKDSELLDKKVVNDVFMEAQLDLQEDSTLEDEVAMYLKNIKNMTQAQIEPICGLVGELKGDS